MRAGRVEQVGTAEELYFGPRLALGGRVPRGREPARGAGRGRSASIRRFGILPGERGGRAASKCSSGPSSLELTPDPDGRGEVVAREFRGHDVFYRVLLDGLELVAQRPSNEVVPLGARVSVRLHEGRLAVLH